MKYLLRLAGGLGNQLFQISKAISICSESRDIFISTKHLIKYAVAHEFATNQIISLESFGCASNFDDYILSLRLPKLFTWNKWGLCLISDKNDMCNKEHQQYGIIDGYFQDSDIKRLENLKPFLRQNESIEEIIAVHFRGGDFFKLGHTKFEINKFYEDAIESALDYGLSRKIYLVTDDPALAKSIESLKRIEIVDGNVGCHFNLIRKARIKIYNNSTFSLCAAALGDKETLCFTTGKNISGLMRNSFLDNERIIQ
jgi:hypothetical protein